jgi:isopentenyl-diphosphate Delta-isomerase
MTEERTTPLPEYMDIVNEKDEVVGKDTRKNIHDTHQIHRGVHVVICNSKGEVLIQKRSSGKDYYPGYYDISVGAQVASGESYEECAHRELAEELGCSSAILVPIAYYDAFSPRQREKRKVFLFRHDGPFLIDPGEVEEVEFVPLRNLSGALQERHFTEGCKKSLCLFMCYMNTPELGMLDQETAKAALEEVGLGEQG